MARGDQVLRFAVGAADGARSASWRLRVPKNKSDVYLACRSLGRDVKVSLHASGPWRIALTTEHLQRPDALRVKGPDPRAPYEWERPQPQPGTAPFTYVFRVIAPWFEVRSRPGIENGSVVWADPPPEGACVEFSVIYAPAAGEVIGYPGRRSMGTELVGMVHLSNGERVFVVWFTHEMDESTLAHAEKVRAARVVDANGNPVSDLSVLNFGEDEGVGTYLDVSLPKSRQTE